MPLDPDVKAALDRRAAAGGPAQYEIPPAELRARQEALQRKPGPEIAAVSDHMVPGPHGDVPVRVYVPITDDPGPLCRLYVVPRRRLDLRQHRLQRRELP